jgi:hypothetical protein
LRGFDLSEIGKSLFLFRLLGNALVFPSLFFVFTLALVRGGLRLRSYRSTTCINRLSHFFPLNLNQRNVHRITDPDVVNQVLHGGPCHYCELTLGEFAGNASDEAQPRFATLGLGSRRQRTVGVAASCRGDGMVRDNRCV